MIFHEDKQKEAIPIRSIVVPSSTVTSDTLAPKSMSKCTLSWCPLSDAIWRAVIPPSAVLLSILERALL